MTVAQIVCLMSSLIWTFLAGYATKDAVDGGVGGVFILLLIVCIVVSFMGAFL